MSSSNALLELMGFGEDDVYPIPWPITHIGGASVLASSIRGGVHLVLFETFDPAETPRRMAPYEPTVLGTAVPFFRAYLDAARDNRRPTTLSLPCGSGVSAVPPFPPRSTTKCGQCSTCPSSAAGDSPSSPMPRPRHRVTPRRSSRRRSDVRRRVSRCAPSTRRGTSVSRGQEGELHLRGPQMLLRLRRSGAGRGFD